MGTIILADVTELETVKISELGEATVSGDGDFFPTVKEGETQKVSTLNLLKDMSLDGGNF